MPQASADSLPVPDSALLGRGFFGFHHQRSGSQMRINISPRLRPNRSVIIFVALVVTTLVATHITQRFVFPTTHEYRELIEDADFVEICQHLGSRMLK